MLKYSKGAYYVAMFVSRNKDNNELEGFHQRRRAFLTRKSLPELVGEFLSFEQQGVVGETSRFYYSVNKRNPTVILRNLQHHLIEHPDLDLSNLEKLIASLSMQKGTSETKAFLFDYDDDVERIQEFLADVKEQAGEKEIEIFDQKTPNGYAVVTSRGFDTRKLLEKWKNVSMQRDGMLFISTMTKG